MKAIFLLSFLIIFLIACNPNQNTNTSTVATDSIVTKTTSPNSAVVESFKTNSKYAAEIKKIDEAVSKINSELTIYKKTNNEKEDCKIEKYLNKNNLELKITSICPDGTVWNFFFVELADKSNKIIYVQYEKAGIRQESYSIGSMVEGSESFGLVLDEKGNKMEGDAYSTFEQLQEEAYIRTM